MRDFSKITEHIYQGSAPPEGHAVRDHGFDVLVLAAREWQPDDAYYPGVEVIRADLDDAYPTARELREANVAAYAVAEAVRQGKRVLCTCVAGRNRSGLITGLAIRKLNPRARGADVVRHIQKSRPLALSNEHFVRIVAR